MVAVLYFTGISSPGPSLVFVITNSLCVGRRQALMSAIGVVVAIAVQVILVLFFLMIKAEWMLFNLCPILRLELLEKIDLTAF